MKKTNKHIAETENLAENPDQSSDYVKYIKMLELQRTVLNKIIEADFSTINEIASIDPGISESV